MKTYVADWEQDGVVFTVSFDANGWDHAEEIAIREGWQLMGEFVEEVDCPDDVEAMIEYHMTDPSIH